MRIGVPKEIHGGEKRVAMTPEVAKLLKKLGFTLSLETGCQKGHRVLRTRVESASRSAFAY